MKAQRVLLVVLAVVWVGLDQLTKALVVAHLRDGKQVALGFVTLEQSRNSGAAFSFAQGATVIFTAVAVGVVVVIARSMRKLTSYGWAVTLGLLLGGAVGNLIDRLTRMPGFGRGKVVDFISVPHFATFNVADSGITIGAILAVLLSFQGIELDGRRAEKGRPQPGTAE